MPVERCMVVTMMSPQLVDDAFFFAEEHICSQTQIVGHGMIMTCQGIHEERFWRSISRKNDAIQQKSLQQAQLHLTMTDAHLKQPLPSALVVRVLSARSCRELRLPGPSADYLCPLTS